MDCCHELVATTPHRASLHSPCPLHTLAADTRSVKYQRRSSASLPHFDHKQGQSRSVARMSYFYLAGLRPSTDSPTLRDSTDWRWIPHAVVQLPGLNVPRSTTLLTSLGQKK